MTVKELKEKLNQFPDSCIVCVPTTWNMLCSVNYVIAQNVTQGVNELDGIVFVDDYVEDDEDD